MANLKQKRWWIKKLKEARYVSDQPEKTYDKYESDYRCGLMCHAMYWTVLTFLPLFLLSNSSTFIICSFVINSVAHAIIDHLKCNALAINLVQDQSLHIVQIGLTFFFFA